MPGINPAVTMHRLTNESGRRIQSDLSTEVEAEVNKLMKAKS